METAKRNLFRNSLDDPSWQEIRYFATIPCPVPCSKYAFFFLPIQYNWPTFLYLHQSWLLQAMFIHYYEYTMECLSGNHQNQSRINWSESAVHMETKHLKSVHKRISTACWIQSPVLVHQSGGRMDPSPASSAVSPSSSPWMPTRMAPSKIHIQRLPEPSQHHQGTMGMP